MSGGHWGYLSHQLEARADAANQAFLLLAALEHELDWGNNGDSCLECSRLRAVAALEKFFDDNAECAAAGVALARDRKQNNCERCQKIK